MKPVLLYPAAAGLWDVRLGRATLFHALSLDAAIQLARQVARDEHARTGEDTCVEMGSINGPVRLELHARRAIAALENACVFAVANA